MKNRVDVFLVTLGMIIGFTVILMHLTGLWPCNIIIKLDKISSVNHLNVPIVGGETFKDFVEKAHFVLTNFFRCK